MTKLTLNVYGENDEILKIYETSHIRWRLLTTALKLNEELKEMDAGEQLAVVGEFILSVFVGMTADELELTDVNDVFNTFNMVVKMANKLGANAKNA